MDEIFGVVSVVPDDYPVWVVVITSEHDRNTLEATGHRVHQRTSWAAFLEDNPMPAEDRQHAEENLSKGLPFEVGTLQLRKVRSNR